MEISTIPRGDWNLGNYLKFYIDRNSTPKNVTIYLDLKSKSQKQQEQEHNVVIDDGIVRNGQIIIASIFLFEGSDDQTADEKKELIRFLKLETDEYFSG